MDLNKDGLPQAVRPVLPPGRTDWTVRNTAPNTTVNNYSLTRMSSFLHVSQNIEVILRELTYHRSRKVS